MERGQQFHKMIYKGCPTGQPFLIEFAYSDSKNNRIHVLQTTTSCPAIIMMNVGDSMNKRETAQQNKETAQERKDRLAIERRIVGEYVSQLLLDVNWSPADLCKHTELNSGNLSKVLRGEKGISSYTLLMIQQAVREEQKIRRQRADFRDEKSEAVRNKVIPPVNEMMTNDGLSPIKIDGVCESITGIIKSAYAP